MHRRAFLFLLPAIGGAQTPQNPSPMVEHTRRHDRLTQRVVAGRREKLSLGTLMLPWRGRADKLLIFFHGGSWLPEVAAASKRNLAVISIQIGAGSGVYSRAFADAAVFPRLIVEAERHAGARFARIALGGWSAGNGAIRTILRHPAAYDRIHAVIAIDGIHTDYANGKPGPLESELGAENLAIWVKAARDAIARRKQLLITHGEIFPGAYASTTETADWLLRDLGVRRKAVLKWGPRGMQQLSEVKQGRFLMMGYAGNSAPDHVDQLHALPELLRRIRW